MCIKQYIGVSDDIQPINYVCETWRSLKNLADCWRLKYSPGEYKEDIIRIIIKAGYGSLSESVYMPEMLFYPKTHED